MLSGIIDLQKNKLQELNKIFRFLEVDVLRDESIFNFITNDAESKPFPRIIRKNIFFRIGNKILPSLTNSIAKFIANKYLVSRQEVILFMFVANQLLLVQLFLFIKVM